MVCFHAYFCLFLVIHFPTIKDDYVTVPISMCNSFMLKELHENANITFMNSNIMWLPLHPTNIRPDHAICFGQWNMNKYNVCHISEAVKGTVSLQGSDLCLLSQMTACSR